MSTPAPPRPPGALHAAQQQLDELDALIQRMLTLPTNPGDEPAPTEPLPAEASNAAPPEIPAEAVETREEPVPALSEILAAAPPDVPVTPRDTDISTPREPAPKKGKGKRKREDHSARRTAPPPAPQEAPDEDLVELLPTPLLDPLEVEFRAVPLMSDLPAEGDDEVLAPAEPFHAESAAAQYEEAADEYVDEEAEPEPVMVATARRGPLVRANQAFDRLTYPLGPAGFWLRSGVGRDVLGWVGVLLITGSVAWAVLDWLGWTW